MEITFLSTQEPITLELKRQEIAFSDITFEKLHAYMITTQGMQGDLKAAKAQTFKRRNELDEINATLYFKDHRDYLSAGKAWYLPEIVHLKERVRYDSNQSILFKSEDLVYNMQNGIAVSETPFTLDKDGAHAEGRGLVYESRARHVKARDVRFTIEEEEE